MLLSSRSHRHTTPIITRPYFSICPTAIPKRCISNTEVCKHRAVYAEVHQFLPMRLARLRCRQCRSLKLDAAACGALSSDIRAVRQVFLPTRRLKTISLYSSGNHHVTVGRANVENRSEQDVRNSSGGCGFDGQGPVMREQATRIEGIFQAPNDECALNLNRGLSDFDRRYRLIFNYVWDLPFRATGSRRDGVLPESGLFNRADRLRLWTRSFRTVCSHRLRLVQIWPPALRTRICRLVEATASALARLSVPMRSKARERRLAISGVT